MVEPTPLSEGMSLVLTAVRLGERLDGRARRPFQRSRAECRPELQLARARPHLQLRAPAAPSDPVGTAKGCVEGAVPASSHATPTIIDEGFGDSSRTVVSVRGSGTADHRARQVHRIRKRFMVGTPFVDDSVTSVDNVWRRAVDHLRVNSSVIKQDAWEAEELTASLGHINVVTMSGPVRWTGDPGGNGRARSR